MEIEILSLGEVQNDWGEKTIPIIKLFPVVRSLGASIRLGEIEASVFNQISREIRRKTEEDENK